MSLITKLTLAISVILIVTMAPFYYLKVQAMKNLLYEEAVTAADNVSETIIKTTHYQMLEDDRKRVYEMIQEAGKQEGIEHIRMIAKDGHIIFSTDRKEIGSYLDKSAAACDMCHSTSEPLIHASTMNRSRVFTDGRGVEVLGITKAIYNQESCYTAACHAHPADQDILGVLDTVVSLERMRVQTRAYTKRLVGVTAAMIVVIWASLTCLVQALVNRPLREILRHTRRVADLQFHTGVHLDSRDEIGELARAFNDMTGKLRVARDELEGWGRNLEAKVQERTRELERMQAQLLRSEKLASLGELVAGIAHELNNPLTGILVLASLLQKEERLDPALREDMGVIVHETHRCAEIVKGLLDFARESIPEKRPCRIHEILDHTLALIGGQSIFHNVTVTKAYRPDLPAVMADPHQLEQVFINMVLNAGQAMSGVGELRLETDLADGHVEVRIRDTGCGIAPENLPKIFDPFFTTKDNGGTGLGLSVSYGIVQNHGGSVDVESAPGHGTTFVIRLPLAPPPEGGSEAGREVA
ncbi:MAG: ATP-binding protein [Deferrisomatales bacterium]